MPDAVKRTWRCHGCEGTAINNVVAAPSPTPPSVQSSSTNNDNVQVATSTRTSCNSCGVGIRAGSSPLVCETMSCPNVCHRQVKCSGIRRTGQGKTAWRCNACQPVPANPALPTLVGKPLLLQAKDPAANTKTKDKCSQCGSYLRPGSQLSCCECLKKFHKKCSGVPRKELDYLMTHNAWTCKKCVQRATKTVITPAVQTTPISERKSEFCKRSSFKVLQWNADDIRTKMVEFRTCLTENNIDIALVQESKLLSKHPDPRVEGYAVVRQDRPAHADGTERLGGGLLTFVKTDIPFSVVQQKPDPDSILETLSIKVNSTRKGQITITNCYCPPIRNTENEVRQSGFDPAALSRLKAQLIAGDLNAHSQLWDDNQQPDEMGDKLEEWLMTNNMMCINSGTATRTNKGTGGGSTPDIAFVPSNWADKAQWSTLECIGSDHLPILITLNMDMTIIKCAPALAGRRWNWKRADWDAFANEIDRKIPEIDVTGAKLTNRIKMLTKVILDSAKTNIGESHQNRQDKCWMTPEITNAIKERNRLRRDVANSRKQWVDKCAEVRELINNAKEEEWRQFIQDNTINQDAGKAWKLIKSLNAAPASSNPNEAMVVNGHTIQGNFAKAESFARHFTAINRQSLNADEKDRKRATRKKLSNARNEPDEDCEKPFSMSELEQAISQMKKKSAPGPDEITPRFLKALGPLAKEFLLQCFNSSWEEGSLPQEWRNATIIPLLKNGKPASSLDSYRPVSLTSCLAKTMERMVGNRLYHLVEERHLLNDDQAGFRKLRGCEDQVIRLSQSVSDGFQHKPSKRTVLALLDYSKAFDKVWRTELFDQMLAMGIPKRYIAWCNGFLRNRQANVRINGTKSRFHKLDQGLPQGAVLSPLLFTLYINRIRKILPAGVFISMYADDIAVWCTDVNKVVAAAKVEKAINAIKQESDRIKLTLNPDKCIIGFFSMNVDEADWEPTIHMAGKKLKLDPNPVFLGITYDRTLSFNAHVKKTCDRVNKRHRTLAVLGNSKWGWKKHHMRQTYLAICRSVMDYCAAAWQPWLAKTIMEKLERCQNRALRLITGQLKTTPLEALRLEAGIPSYKTTSRRLTAKAYEKSLRLPLSNPRHQLMTSNVRQRLVIRSSFREVGREAAAEAIEMDNMERQQINLSMEPPWRNDRIWQCWPDLIGKSNKGNSPEELKADSINTINERFANCDTIIYTDGSASGGMSEGGSAVVVTEGPPTSPITIDTITKKGRALTSSFETELTAIRLAAQYVSEKELVGEVLICTDSLAAVTALKNRTHKGTDVQETAKALNDTVQKLHIQWVPGHSGLEGNELADRAANAATTDATAPDPTISFHSAAAGIYRCIKDKPPEKKEHQEIYGSGFDKFAEKLTRKEAVLLAQLRSGHCRKLAAYNAIIHPGSDPICRRCNEGPEDLRHWLTQCPALLQPRIQTLGGPTPSLSVLRENPVGVVALARKTLTSFS